MKKEYDLVCFEIENAADVNQINKSSKKLKKDLIPIAQKYASILESSGRQDLAKALRDRLPVDINAEVDTAIKQGDIYQIIKEVTRISEREISVLDDDLMIRILTEANPPDEIKLIRSGHSILSSICEDSTSYFRLANKAIESSTKSSPNLLNLLPTTIGLFALKQGRAHLVLLEAQVSLVREVLTKTIQAKQDLINRSDRVAEANEIMPMTYRLLSDSWSQDVHVFIELLLIIELWRSTIPTLTDYCALFELKKSGSKSEKISRLLLHLEVAVESESQKLAYKICETYQD